MESSWFIVKLLDRGGNIVYQFVIKTCFIFRVLDVTRSWLSGNNYKYNGHVVVDVVCSPIDVAGVL